MLPDVHLEALGLTAAHVAAVRDPAVSFIALIISAAAILFLAYALLPNGGRSASFLPRGSWSHTLQLAFSGSAALLASFLLAMVFAEMGWAPAAPPSAGALGTLFVVALFQAVVGTVLAIVLLFVRRAGIPYAATLAVHVMASATLGVLVFLGSSA
jgi:hypothetical protein